MWRFWLTEAIDAAVTAAGYADQLPPLYEQICSGQMQPTKNLDQLAISEQVASMRAITASAFVIDDFYASVN